MDLVKPLLDAHTAAQAALPRGNDTAPLVNGREGARGEPQR